MNLQEWLYNLENRHIQEIKLGLDRILNVAQKADLQKTNAKVITVAGTNGKGSTIAALESLYLTAGYQVGAYTSPHLISFNERIRINGKSIDDEDLCLAFSVIEQLRQTIDLSYFEMTTLAALWYFKQHKLDIILLEVGLGGRLDATNIVDSDIAIITTIDFDHQDYLGNTLEAIGHEKAGILRANKPFIYACDNPPQSIIEKANSLNAKAYYFDKDYHFKEHENSWTFNQTIKQLPKPTIQLKACACAIMAAKLLENELPLSHQQIHKAMKEIFVPGRLQLMTADISVLVDVSHNPQSVNLLAQRINSLKPQGQVRAVFSALKDKDILGLIMPLKYCINSWYPAQLEGKRAASKQELLSHFESAEITTEMCYNSPLVAFEKAFNESKIGDLIVVYGSFYTVSLVMGAFNNLLESGRLNEAGNG